MFTKLSLLFLLVQSLFQANLLDHLPIFQQLNHLELTMKAEEHNVGSLIKFLEHFPKLKYLHFAKVYACTNLKSLYLAMVFLHHIINQQLLLCT